jgi:G3E family GTPase
MNLAILKVEPLKIGLIIVDSELAKESNIDGVQEMLNGCLCCTLVISHTASLTLGRKDG